MICSILAGPEEMRHYQILPQSYSFCPNAMKLCKIHRKEVIMRLNLSATSAGQKVVGNG